MPDSSKACEAGGGLGTSSCLVGELASAGAVILPFSYAGAILHSDGSFQFNGYSTDDSGEPIVISAALLAKEIQSVAQVWPHTRVVVVGHSDGGLVAESWWEGRSSFRDSQVVAKVFSLDSPINGGPNCLRTAVVYKSVAPTWCSSWQDLTTGRVVDARIIAADSDGSYTSVGKTDDPTYGDGLLSLGGGIAAQVVMQCNSDLTGTTCVAPQPISVVLGPQTSPQCENGQADLYGTTDHDVVKVCPTVVNLIVSAVQQAMSTNRSASPTPVPTPTSPAPTTPPQPAPTSTASGDPSSALRFASPGAIAAFLNSQGIACTDYMDADASSVETGAQAEGFCNVAANDVALLTFAGGDGQSQWKAGLRSLSAPGCAAGDTGPDATTTFVLGANWAVYVNGTTDLPSRQLTAQIASAAGTSPAQVCLSH